MILPALLFLSAAGLEPSVFVLRAEDNVWDVAAEDFNQNGVKDILVLSCDEKRDPLRKMIGLHLANPERPLYQEHPDVRITVDPGIGAFMLAQVTGEGPRELVAFDAEGATVYQYVDGRFETIARPRFHSLLPTGSKEPIFLKHNAIDLTGDGIDEWLIPMPTGVAIRHMDQELARVPCDVVSEIRRGDSFYVYHRLPAVQAFEQEGTQVKGLAFLSDEFADFAHGPDWSRHERFRIPMDLEDKWEASAKMADITGNGLPDLVVTQTRGTINLEVLTQVYLAEEPFTYPAKPNAAFSARGAIASPALMDVDGDGKLDMIFIRIPFGVRNVVNFFVRNKVTIQADVHLFRDGGFASRPDFNTTLTLDAPDGREQVAYTMADFDGDGRLDVAFGSGANELVIHTGEPDRFISNRPWQRIDVPSFGIARAFDLDGNAAQDIIIIHPGGPNSKRVEVIVF